MLNTIMHLVEGQCQRFSSPTKQSRQRGYLVLTYRCTDPFVVPPVFARTTVRLC